MHRPLTDFAYERRMGGAGIRRRVRGGWRKRSTVVDPTASVLALSPYSLVEADTYTVDGVTGKTASLVDKVAAGTGIRAITSNHGFVQATSAKQGVLPAVDANFNGALSLQFPAAPFYLSTAPASAWQFLHNGTGMDVFQVFMPLSTAAGSKVIECDNTSASSLTSFQEYWSGTSLIHVIVGAGSVQLITNGAGTLSANVPTYTEQTYVEGGTTDLPFECNRFVKTLSVQAQNSAFAPDLTNSNNTLAIGAAPNGTIPANMAWVARICFNRVLTASERTIVRSYITTKYGVT